MKTKKEKPETIFRVRKTQIKQQVCQKGDRLGKCPADWPCSVAILFSHCKYKLFAENRSPLNSPAGQLLKKILGKTPEIRIESGVTEGKSLLAIPLFFCSPFFSDQSHFAYAALRYSHQRSCPLYHGAAMPLSYPHFARHCVYSLKCKMLALVEVVQLPFI